MERRNGGMEGGIIAACTATYGARPGRYWVGYTERACTSP